ncbi:hypothetical protein dsat_1516 [Alkalidesulfovibrio alkalitolerans DSM 16529]|uniref:Uncharacterized protein n=1 Tax=Alkalidesulfovibrio alkalitolerans DSM 16529 TaxID=1121439 RepID=S7T1F9_9BACT|nr:hypothetical protein [Alkalidesulfovibrio alkalitolerans]EPR30376.1 hypothetical protein dsat_1516 [Alkalidesulfovibrio alkalitolerans DSM 16529]
MTLDKAIVKSFPTGYILHDKSGFNRFTLKAPAWLIIEHWGQTDDGLEWFVAVTGVQHKSMSDGIEELQRLRG